MFTRYGGAVLVAALLAACGTDVTDDRLDDFTARVADVETMVSMHIDDVNEADFPFAVDVCEYKLDRDYGDAHYALLDSIEALEACNASDDEVALIDDAYVYAERLRLHVREHTRQHLHHKAVEQAQKAECELGEHCDAQVQAMYQIEEQLRETLRCRE